MKTAVILPYYNHWDLTHKRLWELYTHCRNHELEIILINDASPDSDCETGVAFWQKQINHHKIRYKRNKENKGFIGSMNLGAKIAMKYNADILVFLSNDVIIYGDFISDIKQIISDNENVLIGGCIIDWKAGWNEITYKGKPAIVSYCEGWLLACTSKVWNTLGGFDILYEPSDYEDVDLSTMAHYLGIKLRALPGRKVEHMGAMSYTYDEKRRKRTERNRKEWLRKWHKKWAKVFGDENEQNK